MMKKNNRNQRIKTYNTGRQSERRTPMTAVNSDRDMVHMRVGSMNRPLKQGGHSADAGRRRGLRALMAAAIALFILPLYVFGVYSMCDVDATVSEVEKRNLKTRPELTASALFDGSYTKDFEEYYADTFPLRDFFLSVNNFFESIFTKLSGSDGIVLVGKDNKDDFAGEALTDEPVSQEQTTESGTQEEVSTEATTQPQQPVTTSGYIVIQGDRAMEMYAANKKQIKAYADAINRLADRLPNTRVYNMLVPTSIEFYGPEEYHAANHSQEYGIQLAYDQMSDKVICVDAYSKIKAHINDYLYFRTDHHWTTLGAYYAYSRLCGELGLTPFDLDAHTAVEVPDFYGTFYSRARTWNAQPDTLTYYDLDNPLTIYTVTGPGMPAEGEVTGLYDLEKLEVYDKYAAFLHGNNGLSRVEGDGEGSILVIKDSYANSLVPFLTANYAAVDVVDLRNYNYGLDALIEANGYDAILLLYSFDSFKADPYLYRAGIEG